MTKQILSAIKVSALALVLSFGLSYALAAWTPPAAQPPNGNVSAPINVGSTTQTKMGGDVCTTISGVTKCLQTAGGADNLGNHTATQALNMGGNNISNAGTVSSNTGVYSNGGSVSSSGVPNGSGGAFYANASPGYWAGIFLGNGGWNANPGDGNGSINVNDVYLRSTGKWMSQVPTSGSQLFSSNGSFTVPASVTKVFISGIGGGGGGGGGCGGNCALRGGYAGYAGSSVVGQFVSVTPGQIIPVTIGTGGNGGWGGAGWNGNGQVGQAGTATSFGTYVTLAGGAANPTAYYATSGASPCSGACGQSAANTAYGAGGVGTGTTGGSAQANSGAGGAGGGDDWTTGYYGGKGGSGQLTVYW